MTTSAIIFMLGSWGFVLGLTTWCVARIMTLRRRAESDGVDPAGASVPRRPDIDG